MKEEDARKKWCKDRALVLAVEAITGNAEGTSNCIASDCALWVEYTVTTSGLDGLISNSWPEGRCGLTNV